MPRIAGQRGPDGILRLCLQRKYHAVLVSERPTQDDDALLHPLVHVRRVRGIAGLLFQRDRGVPLRP